MATTTRPNTAGRQKAQAKYNAKPLQKKRRAQRNAARAKMIAAGRAHKGDGRDVDHKKRNLGGKLNNSETNLRMQSPSKNRSRNN